ncbi:Nudix hydrolase 4 [Cucurbita argyrosperma subsp. argyrosperma]
MGLFFSRNIAKFLLSSFFSSQKFPSQIENVVSVVSARTGRHRQRYNQEYRLVVGCIPYRYKDALKSFSVDNIEVLGISSQKGQAMMFPKGGWENDESMETAALRETLEEAGVVGNIEKRLGKWYYKSKNQATMHEAYMFPLQVTKLLENWPEKDFRRREWMSVEKAREVCPQWMKEALDLLISQRTELEQSLDEEGAPCS